MSKRNVGERGRVLFDSIDLQILELLNGEKYFGVLELTKSLRIKHKNLKPHLEKLMKANLVWAMRPDEAGKFLLFAPSTIPKGASIDDKGLEMFKDFHVILNKMKEISNQNEERMTLRELDKEIDKGSRPELNL